MFLFLLCYNALKTSENKRQVVVVKAFTVIHMASSLPHIILIRTTLIL